MPAMTEDPGFEMARRAGFLESIVCWALNENRPRDAEYRLQELAERWADYQARFDSDLPDHHG